MDGGLQLNISLPSSDSGGSKEKRTAKQRKVEFELRRANKQKKILEIKEKKEKKKVREESKKFEKRKNPKVGPKQEPKDEFASSMLRGEIMPKIHANEGRLVFPHLALNISDSSRKNRSGKIKKKFNSGAKTKELDVGQKYSEPTKKTTSLEEDENANKSALVSFVKKPKVSKNTIPDQEKTPQSKPTGTFFRKSKKASDIEKKGFQFAFGGSSQKAAVAEETVDFTAESAFRGRVDDSQTTVASSAAGGKVSPLKSRGGVVDAAERPRKANKRVRWDADSDAAGTFQEEEEEEAEAAAQRSAKKMKRSGDAGDGEEEGKVWRGKFTSLFGNNPEIPAVPRRAVRPVQEPIFSDENFSELPIHKFLVSTLSALGLTRLTTVQRKAAPVLLAGRDALVRSQTGSGKTLAYALPLVELLQRQRPPLTRADGVRALVVLPTRELALQTYECFLKLVKPFMRLVPGCLVGGEKRKSEKARLRKGITILVGTPGRLLDHVQHTRSLRLDKVQYLVLDEADLLLDMGYERDVASIVAELDSQSQPLLSKEVLAWNRKTYFMDKESPDENTEEKTDHKVGYTSQDSGAGEEEETSEEEVKRTREGKKKEKVEEEEVRKGAEGKLAREEDETSDYDPEERADEIVDAKELEGDKWDEESSEDEEEGEEEEVYRKEEDVWEAEDEDDQGVGVGVGEVQGGAGAVASPKERRRQTVLLSATLSPAVERLAGLALQAPDFVDAADAEMDTKDVVIPDSLVQCYMVVPAKLRLVTLSAFILWKCKFCEERKMLLFCATQDMVDYLTELLTVVLSRKDTDEQEGSDEDDDPEDSFNVGVDFFRLHGQMDQKERTLVFQTFRAADCGVLLCTDVAARGLDLPRVDWIVQWTAPGSVPDYVHRVGRTARVGAAGAALLFLLPAEADFVQMLQDRRIRLQEEKMDNCLKKLSQAIHSSEFPERSSVQSAATTLQLRYENAVLNRRSLHDSAVKAYVSFVRFYASYPKEVRDVFCFKALHLGHQAKSFALRDPPRAIAGIGRRRFHDDLKQQKKEQQQRQRQRAPAPRRAAAVPKAFQAHDRSRMRNLVLSEFDSGLEIPKKTKKRLDDA